MRKFLFGVLQLMRPLEWSKSFGNMAIAAVTAQYVFGIQVDWVRFALGLVAVLLLWSGLYAQNDYADRHADAKHHVKKRRAIPSGTVPAGTALFFAVLWVALAFVIGFLLDGSLLFPLCLAVMAINQFLYSTKPFSLKKRPVVDLVSGSLVNPAFRFYSGWVLFVPAFNAPPLVLLFVLGMQFGGFGLYRMSTKEHERSLGMRSSVVVFGERKLRWVAYISMAVGVFSYIVATLTILPLKYLGLGLLSLLALPLYKPALKRPGEMDMRKMYWLLYVYYFLFGLGFIALSFFF